MTSQKTPRIDLNPGKAQRMDFDSFVMMNFPGKRAGQLRFAFELIWIAHRVSEAFYHKKGLRVATYWHLKEDIEERLSQERKETVKLNITKATIQKALRYMRKAGYLRYVPLDDRWYFSGKAAGALRKLANKINEFQEPAIENDEADRIIHDFCFGV